MKKKYIKFKRVIDIVFSLFVIILMFPLFLLFGILIKFSSPGPILFKENRIGLYGKIIKIYKFRTMYINSATYPVSFTPDELKDPRITRIGEFLRKFWLDELPMFINVLKGDLTFIGPRPLKIYEAEYFKILEKNRFAIKPGITGYWQVYGSSHDLEEMIKMDIDYGKMQSFQVDLKIIIKTIFEPIRYSS